MMLRSASLSHSTNPLHASQTTEQQSLPVASSSSSFNIPMPPPSSSHSRSQRPLGKATSFADLRIGKSKLFKRFHHRKGDFDFGCAGEEMGAGGGFEGSSASHKQLPNQISRLTLSATTFRSAQASTSALPPIPPPRPAPYRFPLTAPPHPEELRRLEREREEALAAQAAIDYMQSSSHARKHSRTSSMAHGDGSSALAAIVEGVQQLRAAPSMSRTPSQTTSSTSGAVARLAGAAPALDGSQSSHTRSGSLASASDRSSASSRPRTNDSLPSFVETASTIDSSGSFPPSPIQSPSLRTRPTYTGKGLPPAAVKVDFDAVAHQPRGYSFI
ncbi:hypothetical protein JCM10908_004599 [Rhodotorula pacifica]|uniref:uncharacterized protein n=1 Tax=Rhodotorula pacifica TaxID=1495444 RepID=UPI00318055D0